MRKRILPMLLAISMLFGLTPTIGQNASAAQTVQIDLIELTDTHGVIGTSTDAIAGNVAVAIDTIRRNNPNGTVVIGGGDYFTANSTALSNRYSGVPVQQWLDDIGLDAQIIGNHELGWAFRTMYGAAKNHEKLLSCNLIGTDGRLLMDKGSVLIEKNGIRLLIVGSMSEMEYSPTYVREIADPVACTRAEIGRYAPDSYDLVIPVCHGDALVLNELAALADEGYPIACVFGGHSHEKAAKAYRTPGGHSVPICIAPAYNEGLAHVRLTYDLQTRTVTTDEISKENSLIEIPKTAPAANDPSYAAFAEAWQIIKQWDAGQGQMPQPESPTGGDLPSGCTPVPGAAHEGSCGAGLSWSLHDRVLSVSGSGEMDDYGKTPAPWLCCGEAITEIRLPAGLTKIGAWAFTGCSQLRELTLPNGLKEIGRYAFYGCSALEAVTVPEGVTAVGAGAFRCCAALRQFSLPDSAIRIGSRVVENTPFYQQAAAGRGAVYVGRQLLRVYPEAAGTLRIADGTRAIADGAIADCRELTDVIFPEGLQTVGTWALYNCKNITKLRLPDSVSFLGESAFGGCAGLRETAIGTGLREVGQDAFYYCAEIKSVSIKDIGAWCMIEFANQYSNPLYFARSLTLNGRAVTELKVPDGVSRIGSYSFYLCSDLVSAVLPASVTQIGEAAFFNCGALTEINLPEGVETVYERTFQNCYNLKGIVLPASVKRVEKNAFASCSRLRYVIFCGMPPVLDAAAFANAAPNTTACVYYPTSTAWNSVPKTGYGGNLLWLPLDGTLSGNVKYSINADAAAVRISGSGSMPSISGFWPWTFTALQQYIRRITFDRQIASVSAWSFAAMAKVESVVLPKNISKVNNDAFRECTALKELYVLNPNCSFGTEPGTLGVPGVTVIYGYSGSTAQSFASKHGYTFRVIGPCANGAHVFEFTSITKPTCTQKGYCLYTCALCGKTKKAEEVPACPHRFVSGVCTLCGGGENDPCLGYTDISRSKWYHAAADFVISRGLMGSTKTDTLSFEPNTACTRSMIVSILYRLEGSPAVTFEAKFPDIKAGKWFTDAVIWAAQKGIVNGYGNGNFGPNDNITREQMAVILKGYTDYQKIDTTKRADLSGFPDGGKVKWSKEAVSWAVAEGLISGKKVGSQTTLDPKGNATRAEVASILMRFIQNIVKT